MKQIIIKPISEAQKKFFQSRKRYVLLSGGAGAGKSMAGCIKGFMLNQVYPGNRGLIVRKEATSLRGSTIKTLLERVIPPEYIISYNQATGVLKHRTKTPGVFSEIVFCGLDKKSDQSYPTKIGSTEYGWIFWDETVEGTKEDWDMLTSRLRYRPPCFTAETAKKMTYHLFGATNPDSPEHWLYKFFFETQSDDREVFCTNPYENTELPADYIKGMEGAMSGFMADRLLHGKWVKPEGVIYTDFDRQKHVTSEGFLELRFYRNLFAGGDANYPLPRAGLLFGETGDGTIHVIDEFYETAAPIESMKDWFEDKLKDTTNRLTGYHDPSDPQSIMKLGQSAKMIWEKANNDVVPGISTVSALFKNNKIKIHPRCVNLIREVQVYAWKKGHEGEAPVKVFDHLCDALRYAAHSRPQYIPPVMGRFLR